MRLIRSTFYCSCGHPVVVQAVLRNGRWMRTFHTDEGETNVFTCPGCGALLSEVPLSFQPQAAR